MGKNSDLTKPCVKCGAVDRYPTTGQCRPCAINQHRLRKYQPRDERFQKPCRKCGAFDRFQGSGACRPCSRAQQRQHVPDLLAPCGRCGAVDRNKHGQCKPCNRANDRRRSAVPFVAPEGPAPACGACGGTERFATRSRSYPFGRCRVCAIVRFRKWKLGISPSRQRELWEAQGGKCACCGDVLVPGRDTHLDHDHETNEVRGFTCRWCNMAIGNLKDSPLRARKLALYLEKHAPKLKLVK